MGIAQDAPSGQPSPEMAFRTALPKSAEDARNCRDQGGCAPLDPTAIAVAAHGALRQPGSRSMRSTVSEAISAPAEACHRPLALVRSWPGSSARATEHLAHAACVGSGAHDYRRPMSDDRPEAVTAPVPLEVRAEAMPPRIVMRNYFSTYLLWASQDFASRAVAIEAKHSGQSRFDIEHRAYVMSAVMNAATFLEAMVNELFQDAADDHGTTGDGYLAHLSPRARELMREWWIASGEGFERLLEKIQLLLVFAGQKKLDKGAQPFQDAALLLNLRNTLIHFRPESVAADVDHNFTKRLRGKFDDNALMAGSENAWWPDHALGGGCAMWAFHSARAIADTICDRLRIQPNYHQHAMNWFAR